MGSWTPEPAGQLGIGTLGSIPETERGKPRGCRCDGITRFCPATSVSDSETLIQSQLDFCGSGAPASHECVPWVPSPPSISLSPVDLGSVKQQALVYGFHLLVK